MYVIFVFVERSYLILGIALVNSLETATVKRTSGSLFFYISFQTLGDRPIAWIP